MTVGCPLGLQRSPEAASELHTQHFERNGSDIAPRRPSVRRIHTPGYRRIDSGAERSAPSPLQPG